MIALRGRFERQLGFAARRLRPGGAFGLSLTVGLVMLVVLGWAFGALLQDVVARNELASVDGSVYRFFLGRRTAGLAKASRIATVLGSAAVLGPLSLAAGMAAWRRTGRIRDLSFAPLVLAGSVGLNAAIRAVIQRPRPPVAGMLFPASGYSFPSEQAASSAACYLALAVTGFAFLSSWRARVVAVAGAVGTALLVGLSRLTLGANWMTDVLGGGALGLLWFSVVLVSVRLLSDLRERSTEGTRPLKSTSAPFRKT